MRFLRSGCRDGNPACNLLDHPDSLNHYAYFFNKVTSTINNSHLIIYLDPGFFGLKSHSDKYSLVTLKTKIYFNGEAPDSKCAMRGLVSKNEKLTISKRWAHFFTP